MNDTSIGDLLRQAAGEPPHDIGVPSVLARARRQRLVLGTQVMAAAVAVTAGAVAITSLQTGSSRHHRVQLSQSPTASPSPTVGRCTSAGSSVRVVSTQGAAGTVRWVVRIVNTSGRTCTVDGFPGMDFHSAHGWLGARVTRGGYPDISGRPRQWVVPAGGSTYFVAYYSDVTTNLGNCTAFDRAEVTLPDDTRSVVLSASGCLTPTSVRVGPVTAVRPA